MDKNKVCSTKYLCWAEENIAHYYKIVGDNAEPYLEFPGDVCLIVHHQLQDIFGNIRAQVEENTK
jgi:hypothetical protein